MQVHYDEGIANRIDPSRAQISSSRAYAFMGGTDDRARARRNAILLCKDVGRPLLITGAFAAEVAAPVFEIGHFELRGFREHQSLYGLCQDGEVPAAPTWAMTRSRLYELLEVNLCL